jgi:inner membrane protein
MDTVTQIVLGGSIAAGFFSGKLGRSSLFFGAFCGWFPDIDVFFHPLASWEGLEFHRSVTHSLLLLPTLAPFLGGSAYGIEMWLQKRHLKTLTYKEQRALEDQDTAGTGGSRFVLWVQLAFWALVTHPILDVFTTYGTQLLYPLSTTRFATDAIAIIDLVYTIPLIIAFVWAIRSTSKPPKPQKKTRPAQKTGTAKKEPTVLQTPRYQRFSQYALIFSVLYLGFCQLYSWHCLERATAQFRQIGFEPTKMRVKPPILFSTIRRVIAVNVQGDFMVANYSYFSKRPPKPVMKQNKIMPEISYAMDSKEGQLFHWFADGFVIPIVDGNNLHLIDGRYGMLSNLWWSPFQARAVIQPDGTTSPLQLVQVSTEIPVFTELTAGWNLFVGNE